MKNRVFQFDAEIKAVDNDSGKFSGYGSVFNVIDSYKEVVEKGAFTDSLNKHGLPALLWQHRSSEVCGVYVAAKEDDRGLYVEGQLNLETQVGREAYALLKQGALKGLSIGFRTLIDEFNRETGINHIKKVRLYEVSLVTFPANESANVDLVKSAPDNIRDFEGFLREAGYSREDAKFIAANGYRAFKASREGGQVGAVVERLESLISTIRKLSPNGGSGTTHQVG